VWDFFVPANHQLLDKGRQCVDSLAGSSILEPLQDFVQEPFCHVNISAIAL
jgi:hypothetical protein